METDPIQRVKILDRKSFVLYDQYVENIKNSKWEKQELIITEIPDEKNQLLEQRKKNYALRKEIEASLIKISNLDDFNLSEIYGKSLRFYIDGIEQYEEKLRATNKHTKENHIKEKVNNFSRDLQKKYVMPFWCEIRSRREK